jgi:hypothetical protein
MTSKYAHQSAAITASPRSAAATTSEIAVTPAAPSPIATIDSPSAMITISPYRSAKCAGEIRHPTPRSINGPA